MGGRFLSNRVRTVHSPSVSTLSSAPSDPKAIVLPIADVRGVEEEEEEDEVESHPPLYGLSGTERAKLVRDM